jgi:hypothetical protein
VSYRHLGEADRMETATTHQTEWRTSSLLRTSIVMMSTMGRRTRKALTWCTVLAAVAVMSVFGATLLVSAGAEWNSGGRDYRVYFLAGAVAYQSQAGSAVIYPSRLGLRPRGRDEFFRLRWTMFSNARAFSFEFPLWPLVVVLGPLAVGLYLLDRRRSRREQAGQCERCGYDRAGLATEAACPECGGGV